MVHIRRRLKRSHHVEQQKSAFNGILFSPFNLSDGILCRLPDSENAWQMLLSWFRHHPYQYHHEIFSLFLTSSRIIHVVIITALNRVDAGRRTNFFLRTWLTQNRRICSHKMNLKKQTTSSVF
jgi:hypothetical protein